MLNIQNYKNIIGETFVTSGIVFMIQTIHERKDYYEMYVMDTHNGTEYSFVLSRELNTETLGGYVFDMECIDGVPFAGPKMLLVKPHIKTIKDFKSQLIQMIDVILTIK